VEFLTTKLTEKKYKNESVFESHAPLSGALLHLHKLHLSLFIALIDDTWQINNEWLRLKRCIFNWYLQK
jgi:hypothetical protein